MLPFTFRNSRFTHTLRRLKANGAGIIDLVDVYSKQVRCVLELAVAVWSPGLTVGQVAQIERVS